MNMMDFANELSRREFLKKSGLGALVATGVGGLVYMGYRLAPDVSTVGSLTDFHYLDDNLTNLHFYFTNAALKRTSNGRTLICEKGKTSYMVVKLPQQHISEQSLREADFEQAAIPDPKPYIHGGRKTLAFISGYSYLAFELFPVTPVSNQRMLPVDDPAVLLTWNNRKLFRPLLPQGKNYKPFKESTRDDVKVAEAAAADRSAYEKVLAQLFVGLAVDQPVTLLEIPQGLLVTPYVGAPTVAEDRKMPWGTASVTIETVPVFSKIAKDLDEFSYSRADKKVTRIVQPVWNSQMWFQRFETLSGKREDNGKKVEYEKTVGEKSNPRLRPVGFLDNMHSGPAQELPATGGTPPTFELLPTYVDKRDLTYLASLGRDREDSPINAGPEWDITARGLTFTGLGAVAKFHYKNMRPPNNMSLVEYEHHITNGRDEFVRVANVGVISVTGQRAVHVRIAQRKIRHGVSYMEYKEYIEIVENDLNYFDPELFKKKNEAPNEPDDFIHARREGDNRITEHTDTTANQVWRDEEISNTQRIEINPQTQKPEGEPAIPQSWATNYRRWPFRHVTALKLITPPIITDKNKVPAGTIIEECHPPSQIPRAFWPVLEKDVTKNAELDFEALDWEGKPVRFTSTFMFIRKEIFDNGPASDACAGAIYANFFNASAERRHIRFADTSITLTRDFASTTAESEKTEKEFENKSNRAKTDFIEYYFSLCKEPVAANAFNRRAFPLFPQLKRAKIYVDNLQSYTLEPLPSIVELNNDYVEYGFQRKKQPETQPGQQPKDSQVYNKARLVLDHTKKFIEGREKFLALKADGILEEPVIKDGYEKIRKAFSGAGDAVGALVNPDFDIQSIGLIKQSVAVAKNINKKYAELEKIASFNPSDLFRQTPELLNGISLLEVLQPEFPAFEGPVNEIKNVVNQLEEIVKEFQGSALFRDLRAAANEANLKATELLGEVQQLQNAIDANKVELQRLKDQLNIDHQFGEIKSLVDSHLEALQTGYLKLERDAVTIVSAGIKELTDELTVELLSNLDALVPYHKKLRDLRARLETIVAAGDERGRKFSASVANALTLYVNRYLEGKPLILFDLNVENMVVASLAEIKAAITAELNIYFTQFQGLKANKESFDRAAEQYLTSPTPANSQSLAAATKTLDKNEADIAETIKRAEVIDLAVLLEKVTKTPQDIELLQHFEQEFRELHATLKKAFGIVRTSSLPFLVDRLKKSGEDIEALERKLNFAPENLAIAIRTSIGAVIEPRVATARRLLADAYLKGDFENSGKYPTLLVKIGKIRDAYRFSIEGLIWEGVGPEHQDFIDLLGLTKDDVAAIGMSVFTTQTGFKVPGLEDLDAARKKIEDKYVTLLRNEEAKLREKLTEYEKLVRDRLEAEARGIVAQVEEMLEQYKQELLNTPAGVAADSLYKKVAAVQHVYNLLTSLTRKEINYSWNTKSLKSADFGIVSFVASTSPATELDVRVNNVIHFQPGQFPPVVDRIESRAENRLTNFGIGLLKAIYVNFNEVSFVAETNKAPKFECKIRDVEFAGAFAFVQALQSIFKDLLGDNFSLDINPSGVAISYLLPIPFVGAPSFGFRDILFQISYRLYFDGRPMELGVGIGTIENKTKLSVGIYTGFFYFNVLGNPKQGITTIEVALEFGGYFGLNLGPLRGEVMLVVGLYYRKDALGVEIQGYFLCAGSVRLWCFSISARFYMGVISRGGNVSGRCTVTYSVKLGFFKKSFSATYHKKFAGATPNDSGSTRTIGHRIDNSPMTVFASPALGTTTAASDRTTRTVAALSKKEWTNFIESYLN